MPADAPCFFCSCASVPRHESDVNEGCFFPSLLNRRAAVRLDGYFPLDSCPAQTVLPLNCFSKIKHFFTYFCKPHYCPHWVFLCAEEPSSSHKAPVFVLQRLWLDGLSVGKAALTGGGKLCGLFSLFLTELVCWVLSKRCLNAIHNICLVTRWNVWDIFVFPPAPKVLLGSASQRCWPAGEEGRAGPRAAGWQGGLRGAGCEQGVLYVALQLDLLLVK